MLEAITRSSCEIQGEGEAHPSDLSTKVCCNQVQQNVGFTGYTLLMMHPHHGVTLTVPQATELVSAVLHRDCQS